MREENEGEAEDQAGDDGIGRNRPQASRKLACYSLEMKTTSARPSLNSFMLSVPNIRHANTANRRIRDRHNSTYTQPYVALASAFRYRQNAGSSGTHASTPTTHTSPPKAIDRAGPKRSAMNPARELPKLGPIM